MMEALGKEGRAPRLIVLENVIGALTSKGGGDFKEVQKLHAEFHKAAAQVLQLALQGKKTEAEKLLAHGAFPDVSARLTSAMMHWQKSAA